ncbi:MAG: porin [Halieaceae bacterium]|jgi:hypothetical protein|nr:porin [Halieaceae bacterium]
MLNKQTIGSYVTLLTLGIGLAGTANADIYKSDTLKVYGDFRARMEQDWDSQKSSGADRDDRLRARVRVRLGMTYKPSDTFEFGVRLRSGSDDSQQSPHITVVDFDDNDTGDAHFNFDKWYLKAKGKNGWGSIGRNGLPMWKPNEMFWDDDVTPLGIAAGYGFKVGEGSKLGLNGGYFSLPAGMQDTCGEMGYGQAVLNTSLEGGGLTAAVGLFDMEGDDSASDCDIYLQDNGRRDYQIWVANLQAKFSAGNRPLKIGVDFMSNSESYKLGEPGISSSNKDETDGWDAYVSWGSTGKQGDWLVGYWYANIEQFAVNNSFAQDDWVRWGSATQTRASNFKGHELRAAYGLGNGMNLVARMYLVEAITTREDGNRFRLDFNYKF